MKFEVSDPALYAILDSGWVPPSQWVTKCQQLLDGGADLIQLRAKKETGSERAGLLERILPLFENRATPLIINDDIDLCLRHPTLGLHVGQDDLDPHEARRRLGPDRILGLSTHSIEQARRAISLEPGILSYFAVGPVFATPTKPDYTPVGLDLVRQVNALKPDLPFFCIGGITRRNLHQARAAGGTRTVIVSDILSAQESADAVRKAKLILAAGRTGGNVPAP